MAKHDTSPTPIFIISLPRSGSTLLQRAIASRSDVATTSEPWVLLPLLALLKEDVTFSIFNHETTRQGIADFIEQLPQGSDSWYGEVGRFVTRLYMMQCRAGEAFFLDKTPRYVFVCNELIKVFPNARFILLWRNPLSYVSSRFHSYGDRWRVYNYEIDLYDGLELMFRFYEQHASRVLAVRYEDLVEDPVGTMIKINEYIGGDDAGAWSGKLDDAALSGRLGDQTGIRDYQSVSGESVGKWKKTVCNGVRRKWLLEYIEWIGSDRLSKMGYDFDVLRTELTSLSVGYTNEISDRIRIMYGFVDRHFNVTLARKRMRLAKMHRISVLR